MRNDFHLLSFLSCAIFVVSAAAAIDLRSPTSSAKSSTLLSNELSRLSRRGVRTWTGLSTRDRRETFLSDRSSILLFGDRLRGGSEEATATKEDSEEEDESEEAEAESEEEEEEEEEESEDEYDESEEEEGETQQTSADIEEASSEYDEPLVPNPMTQLYATLGVMMLSKRIDLYNPTMVRLARFAFIGYLVALQLFVFYARMQAKANDDRTPLKITNPISNLVQSQLQGPGAGSNPMVKNLASSFLSSESTNMEYDLKQANSMQGGLLFNMCFMWFLHFKMEQMQPLLINSITGIMNMVYSPLFQVYVLGRNLERPFKNPAVKTPPISPAEEEDVSITTETTDMTIDEDSDPPADEEESEEESDDEDGEAVSDDESEEESEDDDEE